MKYRNVISICIFISLFLLCISAVFIYEIDKRREQSIREYEEALVKESEIKNFETGAVESSEFDESSKESSDNVIDETTTVEDGGWIPKEDLDNTTIVYEASLEGPGAPSVPYAVKVYQAKHPGTTGEIIVKDFWIDDFDVLNITLLVNGVEELINYEIGPAYPEEDDTAGVGE